VAGCVGRMPSHRSPQHGRNPVLLIRQSYKGSFLGTDHGHLIPLLFLAFRVARDDEPIRPMTLGSMRRHDVRGLFVTCQHCDHERAVNMDDWPDDAAVPSFGPRMRCSRCGKLGATAVPKLDRAGRQITGRLLALTWPRRTRRRL
jgi:hypothetical protein